jgi:hypothetical protein
LARARVCTTCKKDELIQNSRDRKTSTRLQWNFGGLTGPISELSDQMPMPQIRRYAFRALDRQYSFRDMRVGDYLKLALIGIESDNQIYFATILSQPMGFGPSLLVSANAPDLHYFCGRGGKDIIPLWRDYASSSANITHHLLHFLCKELNRHVTAEDLAGYVYGTLANSIFVRLFWEELETPGPSVPITKSADLFFEAVQKGKRLIWLHTYAARMRGAGRGDEVPQGAARCSRAMPDAPSAYPADFAYNEADSELRVGDGVFSPVSPEVWTYSVSGRQSSILGSATG